MRIAVARQARGASASAIGRVREGRRATPAMRDSTRQAGGRRLQARLTRPEAADGRQPD